MRKLEILKFWNKSEPTIYVQSSCSLYLSKCRYLALWSAYWYMIITNILISVLVWFRDHCEKFHCQLCSRLEPNIKLSRLIWHQNICKIFLLCHVLLLISIWCKAFSALLVDCCFELHSKRVLAIRH